MKTSTKLSALFLSLIISGTVLAANPKIVIKTNMGDIEAELYEDKAPLSVKKGNTKTLFFTE
jgi:hypothetical protein